MTFFDELSDDQQGALGLLGRGLANYSVGNEDLFATNNGLLNQKNISNILNLFDQNKQPDYLAQNYQSKADQYMAPGLSPPPVNPATMGSSSDMSDIGRIANAIGKFESGGNYRSMGVLTNGDRAHGKYQIMGNNIPAWSREALGYTITPQQFLANPELQDKIAQYKMAQYFNKYGNVDDVASLWFSGRPSHGNSSKDALGTSVPDYIKALRKNYYG